MSSPIRLLCLELGSTEAGRGVVEELRRIVPGIWIAGVEKRDDYANSVFDFVVTTQYDAFLGRYESVNTPSLPVTPQLHQLMAPHEGKILNVLGLAAARSTYDYPDPIHGVPRFKDSYSSRKDLFDRHCRFWNHVLEKYMINAVVHENLGQEGYDYTALQVARVKKIPTLTFNITGQFPRVLFVQEDEHGLGDLIFGQKLKESVGTSLHREDPNFIRRSTAVTKESPNAGLKGDYSKYETSVISSWLFDRSIYKTQLSFSATASALAKKVRRFARNPRHGIRTIKRSRDLMQSTSASQKEESLHSAIPNLEQNYIYFPLHFQPETSSSIKATGFYRLREAAAFLASELPSGWKLLVKEHPHQFRRLLLREEGFYAQIAAIPRVELVHHTTSNIDLVRHARAVACVSHSSITAHAVFSNIPVISLGDSHFREAPGYFCIKSSAELRVAMNLIAQDSIKRVDGDMDEFLTRLERATFEGEFGEKFPELSDEEWNRTLLVTRMNISLAIKAWLHLRVGVSD